MINKLFLTGFIFFTVMNAFAQESDYEKIKKLFEEFEYEKTIQLSTDLINKEVLSDSALVNIYLMRAVSFYAVGNEALSRKSFQNILGLKNNFIPDPSKISPKLIALFEEVKKEALSEKPVNIANPVDISEALKFADERQKLIKNAFVKNLILPGWGQLHVGNDSKGWIVSGLSAANLGAMIYFLRDALTKENDYLKETDKLRIEQKYSAYNKSYKMRNVFIVSYLLIWIYSQADLLFFSDNEPFSNISSFSSAFQFDNLTDRALLTFRFPLSVK